MTLAKFLRPSQASVFLPVKWRQRSSPPPEALSMAKLQPFQYLCCDCRWFVSGLVLAACLITQPRQ